jgi:hypothetical protein
MPQNRLSAKLQRKSHGWIKQDLREKEKNRPPSHRVTTEQAGDGAPDCKMFPATPCFGDSVATSCVSPIKHSLPVSLDEVWTYSFAYARKKVKMKRQFIVGDFVI